jgi:hypothetical protein
MASEIMWKISNSNLVWLTVIFALLAPGPAVAVSSAQTTMQSVEDLYRAHHVLAQIEIVDAKLIDQNLVCYKARVIKQFKGNDGSYLTFTAFQGAMIGAEYLLAANPIAQKKIKDCGNATNMHSSSGDIFYPIFRSGVLRSGEKWIAMLGVTLQEIEGSPVIDGNRLCEVNLGANEQMRTCNIFGMVVRWSSISNALSRIRSKYAK